MQNERTRRFLRIYRIIHSISLILCGGCLIAGCLSIYSSGDHPYSREIVAATFSKIALPVYLCLALTLGNILLTLLFPASTEKRSYAKNLSSLRTRLCAVKDLSADALISEYIRRQRRNRKIIDIAEGFLLCIISGIFLTYALNSGHFHDSDINGSMIHAMYRLIPCLLAAFATAVIAGKLREGTLKKEITLLKQLPKTDSPVPAIHSHGSAVKIVQLTVFVLSIGLVIFGACTGGIADVIAKAVNICTECIGLG